MAEKKDASPDPDASARTVARRERAVAEHDQTRARLLAAARDIVRKDGAFGLTVAVVAGATGLTRTTVYRYFDGSSDMMYALSDETMQLIYARVAALDPTDRRYLDAYVKVAVEEFCSDSEVNRQTVLLSGTQRFRGEMAQVNPEVIVLENLRARQAQGLLEVDDVELAARAVATYFRGALYGWASGFYTDEEFATEVARSIKAGFALGGGKEVG